MTSSRRCSTGQNYSSPLIKYNGMQTVANSTHPLFDSAKPLSSSPTLRAQNSDEIVRTLFLCRAAQIDLSTLGKSTIISDELRAVFHSTAAALRQCDMKIRNKVDKEYKQQLAAELTKEKVMDIGSLVSMAMRVTSQGEQKEYEDYLYMVTEFLDRLITAQGRQSNLNFNKYRALMDLMAAEIKADAEGGAPMFDYCEATKKVTVQMVHPNNIVDAKIADL